MFLRQ